MAESLSVIATIITTIDIVQKAYNTFQAFCSRLSSISEDSPNRRLKLISFELQSTFVKLTEWKEEWNPGNSHSEAAFSLLWGQAGLQEIWKLLLDIQKPALDISDQTQNWEKSLNEKAQLCKGWLPRSFNLSMPQDQGQAIQNRLNEDIDKLISAVSTLTALADMHFRSMHATTRNDKLQSNQVSDILMSRTATTVVYQECARKEVVVDLDLNLLNNENDVDKFPDLFDWRDLRLSYHLVVRDQSLSGAARESRLESMLPSDFIDETSNMHICSMEQGAEEDPLHLSMGHYDCDFETALDSGPDTTRIRLKGKRNSDVTDIGQETPRQTCLMPTIFDDQQKQQSTFRTLTLVQKVTLAYRIVESSLFLLGTPWLLHLSCGLLLDNSRFEGDGQCSLRVDMSTANHATFSPSQTLESLQLRAVGIALLEVAIGTPCQVAENASVFPLDSVFDQVEEIMGSSYRHACYHCFVIAADSSPGLMSATCNPSEDKLTAYYVDVFLRLRDSFHLWT